MHFIDSEPPILAGRVNDEAWPALEADGFRRSWRTVVFTDGSNVLGYSDGEPSSFHGSQELSDLVSVIDADAREALGDSGQLLRHNVAIYTNGSLPPTYIRGKQIADGLFAKRRDSAHLDDRGLSRKLWRFAVFSF